MCCTTLKEARWQGLTLGRKTHVYVCVCDSLILRGFDIVWAIFPWSHIRILVNFGYFVSYIYIVYPPVWIYHHICMWLYLYIKYIYIYIIHLYFMYYPPPKQKMQNTHTHTWFTWKVKTTPNLHDFVAPAISWNGSSNEQNPGWLGYREFYYPVKEGFW